MPQAKCGKGGHRGCEAPPRNFVHEGKRFAKAGMRQSADELGIAQCLYVNVRLGSRLGGSGRRRR
jgi:Na+-translocating ferredoxin:NAD+ oxidoreductase RNF subunit RnfB